MTFSSIDRDSRAEEIADILDSFSPKEIRFINQTEPWKFLFCVILSAQTTDRMVNYVAVSLFEAFDSLEKFSSSPVEEIAKYITKIGFFDAKARYLKESATLLLTRFDSKVPSTMEELLTLPGVGRKTANCVLAEIYKKSCVIVDTHFSRVSKRLGLVGSKETPAEIEEHIKALLPSEKLTRFSFTLNLLGRTTCKSGHADCSSCPLDKLCPHKF